MPAILRWLVGGEVLRREYGLVEPQAVTEATTVYQEESSILKDFIQSCTVKVPDARTRTSRLYKAAEEWYKEPRDYSDFPLNIAEFGKTLKAYGYQSRTVKGRSVIVGIALLPEHDPEKRREERRLEMLTARLPVPSNDDDNDPDE